MDTVVKYPLRYQCILCFLSLELHRFPYSTFTALFTHAFTKDVHISFATVFCLKIDLNKYDHINCVRPFYFYVV